MGKPKKKQFQILPIHNMFTVLPINASMNSYSKGPKLVISISMPYEVGTLYVRHDIVTLRVVTIHSAEHQIPNTLLW